MQRNRVQEVKEHEYKLQEYCKEYEYKLQECKEQ